jgi:microcystin-dependent protein
VPETITPNYSLIKPEIGGSNDVWGNRINGNLDILDAQIKTNETVGKNSLQKTGTLAERSAGDYLFYADAVGDPLTQSGKVLMSNAAVRSLCNTLMPIGTIIMWGGTAATVPWGWALCNGQVSNGQQTPNLTDRFVMQAGGSWAAGYYGGTSTLSYSGNVGYTQLSVNEMPVHAHSMYDPTHAHNITTSSADSNGVMGRTNTNAQYWIGSTGGTKAWDFAALTATAIGTGVQTYNNGSSWGHTHTIAFALPWNAFYPPFYALCYIMRVIAF